MRVSRPEQGFRASGQRSRQRWRLLVSALVNTSPTEQVSDARGTDTAAGDHPVEGNDTATSTSFCGASDRLAKGQSNKCCLGRFTTRSMKLRGIEVRDPNFDLFIRVGCLTHTEAITIADISNLTRELDARPIGQRTFAWIGLRGGRQNEEGKWGSAKHNSPAHAASFMAFRRLFFARRERTKAFHFVIAARFSGM